MASTDTQARARVRAQATEQAFLEVQREQAQLEQAFLKAQKKQAFLEAQNELTSRYRFPKGKENYSDSDINLKHEDIETQTHVILSSEIENKKTENYEQKICSGDLEAMNNFLRISLEDPNALEEQQDCYDRVIDLCGKIIASRNADAMIKFADLLLKYPRLIGLRYTLYKEAMDLFDANAMYSLAKLWLNRKSISAESEEYNRGEAIYLCTLAAKFDHAGAIYTKANLLENRFRSPLKEETFFEDALESAAQLGHVDAMVDLADLNAKDGSAKKAMYLYNEAIKQNHTGAMYKKAIWILNSYRGSREEQLYALRLLTKAGNLSNSDALNDLAVRHEKKKDYQRSFPLYEKALFLGHMGAMQNIINILLDSPGTQEDKEICLNKLRELCERIINFDNSDIMTKMAFLLSKQPDRQEETFMLYEKAIELDNADAMNNLADLLRRLPTTTKDEKIKNDIEALTLYKRAIFLGNVNAIHSLFNMLLISTETKELNEMGIAMVLEVCEQVRIFGNTETMNNLGELLEIYSNKFPEVADKFSKITFILYKEAKELGDPVASRNLDRLEQQRNAQGYQPSAKDLPFFKATSIDEKVHISSGSLRSVSLSSF